LKVTREFKVGLLAVITILLFVWGLNYLKGKDIFSKQTTFYAIYSNVAGLIESNPVSVNGVNIGQVNKISFMPDGSGRILVECIVDQSVPIPVNSTSVLTGASLTGSREIIITLGDSREYISSGDTLATKLQSSFQEEVSQMVIPLKQRAEDLFDQVDSVMMIVRAIFDDRTRKNITSSISSMQQTLANIEKESGRITNIMANAESISQNLRNNNETLTNILNNFSSISDSLAAANVKQTMMQAEQSISNLNAVLDKINNGAGTMGQLVNDENLYNNLDSSARQLDMLLEDIRNSPGKYIRLSIFGR
jgi:phospholipid/cholesterol/gamma-HCH transport system substrate-binding protein